MSNNPISTKEDKKGLAALTNQILKDRNSVDAIKLFKYFLTCNDVDLHSAGAVEKRFNDYIDRVSDYKLVVSYEGLAMSLKMSVEQLNQIEAYALYGVDVSKVITAYKNFVAYLDYNLVLDSVISPSVYELRAGYFSGINKKTSIEVTPTKMREDKSLDEIKNLILSSKDLIE